MYLLDDSSNIHQNAFHQRNDRLIYLFIRRINPRNSNSYRLIYAASFRRKSALQQAEEDDVFEKITYYRNHTTAITLEVLKLTRENICIEFIILKKIKIRNVLVPFHPIKNLHKKFQNKSFFKVNSN